MTKWVGYCSRDECVIETHTYESETPEEAIIPLAKANDLLPGERITIGTIEYPRLNYGDLGWVVDSILDEINEMTESVCEQVATESLTKGDICDLRKRLERAVEEWINLNDLKTSYWICYDGKEYTIPEEGYWEE